MKTLIKYGIGIALILLFLYGCYWTAKTVSYNVFYEDMVVETVQETVKPQCLQETR